MEIKHYWSLTIRLFNVISRTPVEGVLPLCRNAISIFCSPNWLVQTSLETNGYLVITTTGENISPNAWVKFYEISVVAHAACLSSTRHGYSLSVTTGVGLTQVNIILNCLRESGSWFLSLQNCKLPNHVWKGLWIRSFPSPSPDALPKLKRSVCAIIYAHLERRNGFMPFLRTLVQNEM